MFLHQKNKQTEKQPHYFIYFGEKLKKKKKKQTVEKGNILKQIIMNSHHPY